MKNIRSDQGHGILNGCIPVYQHLVAHYQDNMYNDLRFISLEISKIFVHL